MIYVSFTEILGKSRDILTGIYGNVAGNWYAVISFFGGVFIIALIDFLIPSFENPHEAHRVEELVTDNKSNNRNKGVNGLLRMGIFIALAIAIHNFPEGIATFTAGITDTQIAIPIAVAIAIHNIPEGIAISIPIYYATGRKRKAFILSFLSGLAEPLGALIGYSLLYVFVGDTMLGILFGSVAGVMVFISVDELLPTAREYGYHHYAIFGLIFGMVIMAISLLLFL